MTDISIIVPIYNAEKYLSKCINSLINQTKKEIEIILINDGSTDRSEEIINNYRDERIKYFKNENQGIGKTRNFGIEKATGKYLMFVDSDDYLKEDACEILFKKAEKEKLDLVICNYYKVDEETEQKKEVKEIKPTKKPYYIGAHVSSAGGAFNAVENASLIGANAFALFLKYMIAIIS